MANSHLASLVAVVLLAVTITNVRACTCAQEDFQTVYYRNIQRGTPFSIATVLSSKVSPPTPSGSNVLPPFNQKRIYKVEVSKVYADCAPAVPYKSYAITSTQGSLCGIGLLTGVTYLMPLKPGSGSKSDISLCNMIMPVRSIPADVKKFLDSRKLCCKGKCECGNGKTPLTCKKSACKNSKMPCAEAYKCVDNSCAGCRAEWFTNEHLPACRPSSFAL